MFVSVIVLSSLCCAFWFFLWAKMVNSMIAVPLNWCLFDVHMLVSLLKSMLNCLCFLV